MTNPVEAMAKRMNWFRFTENGWMDDDEETSWSRLTPKEKRLATEGQRAALQALKDNTLLYDRIELVLVPEEGYTLSRSNGVIMLEPDLISTEEKERT